MLFLGDTTILSGLAALFGCLCMGFVCTAQVRALLAALRPVALNPWEQDFTPAPAPARAVRISPAPGFMPMGARA